MLTDEQKIKMQPFMGEEFISNDRVLLMSCNFQSELPEQAGGSSGVVYDGGYPVLTVAPVVQQRQQAVLSYTLTRGRKHYELVDHVKNVLVVISDRKFLKKDLLSGQQCYVPEIKTIHMYYPYGTAITLYDHGVDYRYNFNGQEKIHEFSDKVSYRYRYYCGKISRFISLDLLKDSFAGQSPYVISSLNPIKNFELEGLQSIEAYMLWNPCGIEKDEQDLYRATVFKVLMTTNLAAVSVGASALTFGGAMALASSKPVLSSILLNASIFQMTSMTAKGVILVSTLDPQKTKLVPDTYMGMVGRAIDVAAGNESNTAESIGNFTESILLMSLSIKMKEYENVFLSSPTLLEKGREVMIKIQKVENQKSEENNGSRNNNKK